MKTKGMATAYAIIAAEKITPTSTQRAKTIHILMMNG